DGMSKHRETVDATEQREVLLADLAESDAAIDHDLLTIHPGRDGRIDQLLQLAGDVFEKIVVTCADVAPAKPLFEPSILRPAAIMHEDHGAATLSRKRGQPGIEAKGPDIVDDGRARLERGSRHLRLRGVDGDR